MTYLLADFAVIEVSPFCLPSLIEDFRAQRSRQRDEFSVHIFQLALRMHQSPCSAYLLVSKNKAQPACEIRKAIMSGRKQKEVNEET